MSKELTKQMHSLVDRLKPQMALALPKHMDAERLSRIALTEMRKTPKLMQCSHESIMKCLMVTAQLGLEPGLLGHVYLIPYKKEATVIIGYKGMIDLARRSGEILSIEARWVCENDPFELRLGCDSTIVHTVDIHGGQRGRIIGYYAIAKLKGGGQQFEFMTTDEIEKVRESSPAGNSGPWQTHPKEMGKKTVIRRLFKYLPVSVEIQKAVNLDESSDRGAQKDTINDDFIDLDLETGEVIDKDGAKTSDAQINNILNK